MQGTGTTPGRKRKRWLSDSTIGPWSVIRTDTISDHCKRIVRDCIVSPYQAIPMFQVRNADHGTGPILDAWKVKRAD